jgi:hypothetical protein
MHKILKDYLMTSTGDLLRVVGRIEQMVKSQYSKYAKEIASSKHRTKFQHKLESMPFLPPDIHDILTAFVHGMRAFAGCAERVMHHLFIPTQHDDDDRYQRSSCRG